MSSLYFHPVWEETLSSNQKEKLHAFFQTLPAIKDKLTAEPFLIKHKKNGGIVATVLLQNGFDHSIEMNETNVQLKNKIHEIIAEEAFELNHTIPANTTMSWSFVFSKDKIRKLEEVEKDWTVLVQID